MGAAVVVAMAVVAGVVAIVLNPGGPSHPDEWDQRVAPIADWVADERDLEFEHPVHVEFLTAEEYTERTQSSDEEISASDQQELDDAVSQLRALGLVQGEVDLSEAGDQLTDTGTAAFYNPESERIFVRGTELTPLLRVTIAHELTHVLQDQHFDIGRLEEADEGEAIAFRAVLEGDASRIEDAYVDSLTPEERMQYEEENQAVGEDARSELEDEVPPILIAVFAAPYQFGERFVEVIERTGESTSVDDVIEDPPTSEEQLLDPFVYLEGDDPTEVDAPPVPEGAEELDSGTLASLTWYLMLAERLDFKEALEAVDGWGGDQYAVYRQDDTVCVAARFEGDTDEDTAEMEEALAAYADQVQQATDGAVDFTVEDGSEEFAEFRSCDPGPEAELDLAGRSQQALVLPIVRTDIAAGAIQSGATREQAVCLSQEVIERLPLEVLTSSDPAVAQRPDVVNAITEAGAACR